MCRSKPSINELSADVKEESEPWSSDLLCLEATIGGVKTSKSSDWTVSLRVNNQNVNFKIDTGADVTVISSQFYDQLFSHNVLRPSRHVLRGPDKHQLKAHGFFFATLERGKH